ncbi:MAG TPA: hypothetical protein H9827_10930 [Candidatus Luteimonas excrementigallinarum]|nr:hypothetical protein [Candidatus Luteimonas excrementigallinarum]
MVRYPGQFTECRGQPHVIRCDSWPEYISGVGASDVERLRVFARIMGISGYDRR